MALGKCRSFTAPKRGGLVGDEGLELGLVRYTRSFGRKRIVISNNSEDSSPQTPVKKRCGERNMVVFGLEALPQDVLIRIICHVDHEDLTQLSHVSKAIREATLVAKKSHFAYTTPKKVRAFRTAIDFEESASNADDEIEAPNAPKQSRQARSRLVGKKLDSLSVNLFD